MTAATAAPTRRGARTWSCRHRASRPPGSPAVTGEVRVESLLLQARRADAVPTARVRGSRGDRLLAVATFTMRAERSWGRAWDHGGYLSDVTDLSRTAGSPESSRHFSPSEMTASARRSALPVRTDRACRSSDGRRRPRSRRGRTRRLSGGNPRRRRSNRARCLLAEAGAHTVRDREERLSGKGRDAQVATRTRPTRPSTGWLRPVLEPAVGPRRPRLVQSAALAGSARASRAHSSRSAATSDGSRAVMSRGTVVVAMVVRSAPRPWPC